jgi:hypothetical protein
MDNTLTAGTMDKKPFSFRRALDNDFNLTITFVIPLVIWAIYLLARMLGSMAIVILVVAVLATLLSPVYLYWRLRAMRTFYNLGETIPGELVKVYFFQDRGRVDYLYSIDGKKYSGSIAIHKNANTQAFEVGQAVTVVVDKAQPDKGLVAELYS